MTSPPGPIGAQWRSGRRRAAGAVIGWRARAGAHAGGGGGRYKGGGGQCVTPRIGGDTGTAPAPPRAPLPGKRRAGRGWLPAPGGSRQPRVSAGERGFGTSVHVLVYAGQREPRRGEQPFPARSQPPPADACAAKTKCCGKGHGPGAPGSRGEEEHPLEAGAQFPSSTVSWQK